MDINRIIAVRTGIFPIAFIFAAALSGCGGTSPGPVGTGAPTISLVAAGPTDFARAGGAKGFDASGTPVYATAAADSAGSTNWTWTIWKGRDQPSYTIPLAGVMDSKPLGISGKFVVGAYRDASGQGLAVATQKGDGSVLSARYLGYDFDACNSGKAIISRQDSLDLPPSFFMMDLASGSVTAETLPAGDLFFRDFKGRFVLCEPRGSSKRFVYDADTNATLQLEPAADTDGTVETLAVNSAGQVLGFTRKGDVAQLRVWNSSGVPGDVIDTSASGGDFFLGWLSPDASRMAYKKTTASSESQFVRTGGVSYDVTSSTTYTSLNGLNDDGTVGFAADLSASESPVTVAIAYK